MCVGGGRGGAGCVRGAGVSIYACGPSYGNIHTHKHTNTYMHTNTHTYTYMYVYICMHKVNNECVSVCITIFTYLYKNIYLYIPVFPCVSEGCQSANSNFHFNLIVDMPQFKVKRTLTDNRLLCRVWIIKYFFWHL